MIALADVAVVVSDAKKSAAWWEEKLGFASFTLGGEGGHAVLVAPPGERFVLHLCAGFAPLEPGNTGIAFVSDDVKGLAKRLMAKGVRFPEPPVEEAWGARAKFEDPDGNLFWLVGAPTEFVKRTLALKAPAAKRATKKARAGAERTKKARRTRPARGRPARA